MGSVEEYDGWAAGRWTSLVHAAMLLGASHAEAEDLAQTVLVQCYVAWGRVQRARDTDAYVTRVLLNAFRGARRRRWTGEVATARLPEAGPAAQAADRFAEVERVDAVERALGGLSADHRAVVVLRYYLHLPEAQIATVLGVAPGTVKSRLSRALAALAASPHLSDLDPGGSR